jgi:hypothetical protein
MLVSYYQQRYTAFKEWHQEIFGEPHADPLTSLRIIEQELQQAPFLIRLSETHCIFLPFDYRL